MWLETCLSFSCVYYTHSWNELRKVLAWIHTFIFFLPPQTHSLRFFFGPDYSFFLILWLNSKQLPASTQLSKSKCCWTEPSSYFGFLLWWSEKKKCKQGNTPLRFTCPRKGITLRLMEMGITWYCTFLHHLAKDMQDEIKILVRFKIFMQWFYFHWSQSWGLQVSR